MPNVNLVLTQNFKTLAAQRLFGSCYNNGAKTGVEISASGKIEKYNGTTLPKFPTSFKSTNGSESVLFIASSASNVNTAQAASINCWSCLNDGNHRMPTYFRIGSGSTEPSVDDYNLENGYKQGTDFTATLHINNLLHDASADVYKFTGTFNVVALVDISISELGMFSTQMSAYSTSNGVTSFNVLLARGVFDEPIVLAAGSGVNITFEIDFKI